MKNTKLTQQQIKLLESQKWSRSESDWVLIGTTGKVRGFEFINVANYEQWNLFMTLIIARTNERSVCSNNDRITIKITNTQIINKTGLSKATVIKRMRELIDIGLVSVKFKSGVKTPNKPSEYYLNCPATLALKSCKLDEPKVKEVRAIKESAW